MHKDIQKQSEKCSTINYIHLYTVFLLFVVVESDLFSDNQDVKVLTQKNVGINNNEACFSSIVKDKKN